MKTTRGWYLGLVASGVVVLLASGQARLSAQSADPAIRIGGRDLGGVVTSANGPEAGVWVIAETTELPTKFARIVVTDDRGRYVLPDLPRAAYQLFVRGYGLVDSQRVAGKPGQRLDLKAVVAPDARTAAHVYPAAWWLTMVKAPSGLDAQKKFSMDAKECFDCHQLGNKATREILPSMSTGTASTLDRKSTRLNSSHVAISYA